MGVAAARLWTGDDLTRIWSGRTGDWPSPLDSERARAAHLLRRVAFGADAGALEQALRDGYRRTVDRLLETRASEPPALAAASAAGGRFNVQLLQQWWVEHILTTPTPFTERMTYFWHNHFPSDYRKVGSNTFLYWQNLTWRRMALADLREILRQVTVDPAMLRYLDLATSTGSNPNENYARELMELFTMGEGSFQEEDVRAGARALAGWTLPSRAAAAPAAESPATGVFVSRRAYQGEVSFLGKRGHFDTGQVIDRILAQQATAPFIVSNVLQHFVTPRPDASYVRRLADRFRASRYDVRSLMRDVLLSPEFTSGASYRSLVKSPLEFMVEATRVLGAARGEAGQKIAKLIAGAGAAMGQALFDPPDVAGWPINEGWISSSTVVARVNFISDLLQAAPPLPRANSADREHLDGVLSPQTAGLFAKASDDRSRWLIVLASPEFQLK
jgi:uncharacterized protein (DUF1800 family)